MSTPASSPPSSVRIIEREKRLEGRAGYQVYTRIVEVAIAPEGAEVTTDAQRDWQLEETK